MGFIVISAIIIDTNGKGEKVHLKETTYMSIQCEYYK